MRRNEVEATTGLSKSSIYAMMGEGKFPKPYKIGERAVGWSRDEIEEWLAERRRDDQ